jgi:hypothetical protein
MISPLLYCEQLPRFTAVAVVTRCVGFSDSLRHWLAGLGPASWWIHEAGMLSVGKVGGAARIVLGLLYPRWLQKKYHAAGGVCTGECRNRTCQVRSWSSEEAGLDLENRWEIGPFAHTCESVMSVSVGPSVVGRDWSPVSSNKARGCCCRTPGDHHRAPLQPGRAARRYLRTW